MTESRSPALTAYEEVSVLRNKHAGVIHGDQAASTADLRAILTDLDAGLVQLSTPLNHDLAEGNVYLRFRRVNFLTDKIIVLDRLEDHVGEALANRGSSIFRAVDPRSA